MFKKMLFVFVLAAAVLAFAGYGVPTAAACSGSVTSCNAMFGPSFETTVEVTPQLPSPLAMSSQSSVNWDIEKGPLTEQQTTPSAPSQPPPLTTPPCSAPGPGCGD